MGKPVQVSSVNDLARYFTFICASLVLGLSLSACIPGKPENSLDATLNEFRKALRWGYYDAAVAYIKTKEYDKPLRSREFLKNIRLTSYENAGKRFLEDEDRTEVLAIISFYDVNRGSVVTMQDRQIWWRDPETSRWFLDGDIPDFFSALE